MNSIKPYEAVVALILCAAAVAALLRWIFLIFSALIGG